MIFSTNSDQNVTKNRNIFLRRYLKTNFTVILLHYHHKRKSIKRISYFYTFLYDQKLCPPPRRTVSRNHTCHTVYRKWDQNLFVLLDFKLHKHSKCHTATYQVYFLRKTPGTTYCITSIAGTSRTTDCPKANRIAS
jgi:hypothetical protein